MALTLSSTQTMPGASMPRRPGVAVYRTSAAPDL
uniref:Uncharacterized protein n=1 Tax=Human herpesvirus 2 TaxID=10310 RepID=A0A481TWW7_HHV2|nr:hypothetical protein [Human alphaherpesvirus 2]